VRELRRPWNESKEKAKSHKPGQGSSSTAGEVLRRRGEGVGGTMECLQITTPGGRAKQHPGNAKVGEHGTRNRKHTSRGRGEKTEKKKPGLKDPAAPKKEKKK